MNERPVSTPTEDSAGHPGSGAIGAAASGAATAAAGGEIAVTQASLWGDAWRQLRRNPLFIVAGAFVMVLAIVAIFPGLFTNHDPNNCQLQHSLERPRAGHPFGFDIQGCDYFTRVLYGARSSLIVGVLVVAGFTLIGGFLGAMAGYYGKLTDALIARFTDVIFAIPTVLGAVVILNLFANRGILQVSLVLVAFAWPTTLRLMRSSILSIKEMDYVQAARALGANDRRIIFRHILPNAMAPVVVYATIATGTVISAEAALSFLGVGQELPAISWGLMISAASSRILLAPHLLFFPGVFLSLTVLSFILMGDALRDALDPRLR